MSRVPPISIRQGADASMGFFSRMRLNLCVIALRIVLVVVLVLVLGGRSMMMLFQLAALEHEDEDEDDNLSPQSYSSSSSSSYSNAFQLCLTLNSGFYTFHSAFRIPKSAIHLLSNLSQKLKTPGLQPHNIRHKRLQKFKPLL